MRAHDVALSHLNARGFIQFHPHLAQRLGDFKAAIFMGHALYWSKHLAHIQPQRKGWFFMSAAQWTQATGLSTREQTAIRASLVAKGLLLEALAGRPALMHFKVELLATAKLLNLPTLTWESMTELFRSGVRFYKPLSDICGGVGAGLYLSYLLQRQSYALRHPPTEQASVALFPDEFTYRPEQARQALCLGSKVQRNARDKLKAAGFIREGRSSMEVVSTRVNLAAIASCLQAQGERSIRKASVRGAQRPGRGRAASDTPDLALVNRRGQQAAQQSNEQLGTEAFTKPGKLQRIGSLLPQRQLNLFSPIGLIWPGAQSIDPEEQLAPQDDAATLNPNPLPVDSPTSLVLTMFAPALAHVVRAPGQDRAQITGPESRDASVLPDLSTDLELSTDSVTSGNSDALLSNAICRFVDPNLPFCRKYKEQGISRYLQTTTTRPVDNLAGDENGRRRVESNKPDTGSGPETAVDQKIAANRIKSTPVRSKYDGAGWGRQSVPKDAVGPQIDARSLGVNLTPALPAATAEPGRPGEAGDVASPNASTLVLPDRLDVSMHAGVLATITQAPLELQQAFLDELSGQMGIPNKTIHNPIGWLHSLIRRNHEGFVALALAPQVAALRTLRQQHEQRQALASQPPIAVGQNMIAASKAGAAAPALVEDSEIKRATLERLKELKQAFASDRGGRR